MNPIEHITWQDAALCYITRTAFLPAHTTFLTPPEFKQQVGYVVCPAGGEIRRHIHQPLERQLVATRELFPWEIFGCTGTRWRPWMA